MDEQRVQRRLSPRELECLTWVSLGKSSTDIGAILDISSRTVDAYLEKACAKLNVRTRIEAVVAAVQMNLITCSEFAASAPTAHTLSSTMANSGRMRSQA